MTRKEKRIKSGRKAKDISLAYFVWDSSVGDFETTYREVAAAGIRNVVIDARRGNLNMEVREDVARARQILARLGLSAPGCHGLTSGACSLTEEDDGARRIMLRAHLNMIKNSAELAGKTYVIHVGFGTWPEPEQRRAAWERVRRALDKLAPAAQTLGMTLALENGFTQDFLIQSAGELVSFVSGYGHPAVGICYDSGHAHIAEGEVKTLKTLVPHVVTMHLHDNNGREDEHLIPGEGTIDWPALVPVMGQCPRLIHIETEAANAKEWEFSRDIRPVRAVYERYLEILNAPGSGLSCR
jgi:sugar phosphate isomerase/epimerase